jgi:hypothetical protein
MKEKVSARDRRLRKKYNITEAEYNQILEAQGGACAICCKPAEKFQKGLHVDHDHSTHLVRGLLCWACNRLLPSRTNLAALLSQAIFYLGDPPAEEVIGERYTPGKRKCRT